jgi:hypothetical protein
MQQVSWPLDSVIPVGHWARSGGPHVGGTVHNRTASDRPHWLRPRSRGNVSVPVVMVAIPGAIAAVLLCLAGRRIAVAPAFLASVAPSRRCAAVGAEIVAVSIMVVAIEIVGTAVVSGFTVAAVVMITVFGTIIIAVMAVIPSQRGSGKQPGGQHGYQSNLQNRFHSKPHLYVCILKTLLE